jgi:hypothetical protein
MTIYTYISVFWAPLLFLVAGCGMVGLFLYLHMSKKRNAIAWLAKYVFRSQMMNERSAESLFNVASSFVVMIGGIWILMALYVLTYSA